jgi:hypothetical protein
MSMIYFIHEYILFYRAINFVVNNNFPLQSIQIFYYESATEFVSKLSLFLLASNLYFHY